MMADLKANVRGLTLIEVLIAASILFAMLTVVSESYRASLMASSRADDTIQLLTPLPLITSAIRQRLNDSPSERVEGDGELLGVRYRFVADSLQHRPPLPRFDQDSGEFVSYPPRFRLYAVSLELRSNRISRSWRYNEVAWSRALD
jgi:type II secretory pathway component PulJ